MEAQNWNFKNSFEYSIAKSDLCSVDFNDILKNNIMLNSHLAEKYHTIKKIVFNEVNHNFEFKVATKPDELLEALRLRFLSYSNEGFIDPNYFSEGLEYDKYDKNAIILFVRNLETNNLHACVRLVLDFGMGLPLEEFVHIDDFRTEDKIISEISRLISLPKGQRAINRGLLAFAYKFALDFRITHLIGFGRLEKLDYYESIGLRKLEPMRIVKYRNIGNGHMPPGEFYVNVINLKEFDFNQLI